MSFLTDEQKDLANEIAALLTERGETVEGALAETAGFGGGVGIRRHDSPSICQPRRLTVYVNW